MRGTLVPSVLPKELRLPSCEPPDHSFSIGSECFAKQAHVSHIMLHSLQMCISAQQISVVGAVAVPRVPGDLFEMVLHIASLTQP